MPEQNSRRIFLKSALVSAGAVAGLFASVKFDAKDGVKIGAASVKFGMSEAQAMCGGGVNCAGGGGECGGGVNCAGGGGRCGGGVNCAGGGGQCGGGVNCGGQ
jgi:hypothetical protein